jgi:hypothetical protein
MSVMLSFGLALGSLGYKQQVLASSSVASQYAFYAADAGLECVLYYDQRENVFAYEAYDGNPKSITCEGVAVSVSQAQPTLIPPRQLVSTARVSLDSGRRCADVSVYKPRTGEGAATYLFAQGYDVPCTTVEDPNGARFVSRGIYVRY